MGLRIYSWNVNGLRAAMRGGFLAWLEASDAFAVGLQEVRAREEQLPPELREAEGWTQHYRPAQRPGYSGVGMISRRAPDRIWTELGEARFDDEGRLILARFGKLIVASVYFPNGNGRLRDNSRIPYKLDFYRAVFDRLMRLRRGGYRVLALGDYNTAHKAIDLARPKQNVKTSGFRPEERAELDRWMGAGWIDTFRRFEPGPDHYTWWSQRGGARDRNVGWRIDYVLASPNCRPFLRSAFHCPEVRGSDHCPLGVEVDEAILG